MDDIQSAKPPTRMHPRMVAVLATILVIGALFTWRVTKWADRTLRDELLRQAQVTSLDLKRNNILALTGTETDLTTPSYLQLNKRLAFVKDTHDLCQFIYLLDRLPDGRIKFLVDNNTDGFTDKSPAGHIYEEISPEFLRAIEDKSELVGGPVTDRWGTWVTALVPLTDPTTDELIAVLGMNIAMDDWRQQIAMRSLLPVSVLLALLILLAAGFAAKQLRPKSTTKPVQHRLLIPLASILLLLVCGFGLVLFNTQQISIRQSNQWVLQSAVDELPEALAEQALAMDSLQEALLKDERLRDALKQQDRQALLATSEEIFKHFQGLGITHFYFNGPDRVNLLRVHKPEKHGDIINRFTTRESERTGKMCCGIELGSLGTFTLRVVQPVFDNGTLVGYLELGKEIEDILERIHETYGTEMAVSIHKSSLKRERWETGMTMLGRESDWDRYSTKVLIYSSLPHLPAKWEQFIHEESHLHHDVIEHMDAENKKWQILISPLSDASGNEVGDLIVCHDISANVAQINQQLLSALGIGSVLLAILFGVLYVVLRQIDMDIHTREADLERSEQFQRRLIETSPDFIFVLDAQGIVMNVNRVQPGHRKEDVIGQNAIMFMPPDDRDNFNQVFRQAVDTGQLQTVEQHVDLADGRHYFYNRLNPIHHTDESVSVVLIATDITARRLVEEQLADSLKESERMNRLMIGRETRVLEMKKEVNDLLKELGRDPRFQSVE